MKSAIQSFVLSVLLGSVLLIPASHGCRTIEDAPLMLTPDMVDGEWPFLAPEVRVSCCQGGRLSIVDEGGQSYWFPGGWHRDRFPVEQLGKPDADFTAAYDAAYAAVGSRWPELRVIK